MAINLLIGSGGGQTSAWAHVEPAKSVSYPLTISIIPKGWTSGNVNIEQLIGGLPAKPNTPYGPQSDTGDVILITSVGPPPAGSNSWNLEIDTPMDFMRARTDTTFVGKVDVFGVLNA